MLTRTNTPMNLLDVMQELEILDCSFLNDGEWIKITDRKTLYHAAIVALLEAAESDGFVVTREGDYSGEAITAIHVDNAPETECDQLGGGCTCESCTAQITALGIPIDLDTHEFTDDCEACSTGTMAGVIPGVLSNGERCDTCELFADDESAAKAIANRIN